MPPGLARPKRCREFGLLLITAMTGPEGLTPCRVVFLDAHVSVAKAHNLFLAALTRFHDTLLPTFDFSPGRVAFHFRFVSHNQN